MQNPLKISNGANAKILDGKKLAEKILNRLKKELEKSKLKLRLVVIQVGENPISRIFINQKRKACGEVSIDFKLFKFPAKISNLEFKKEIEKIVKNPINSGIIIQLPVPKKFQPEEEFTNLIPEEKDVDVLSETSFGKFFWRAKPILPPVVKGISYLLKEYKIKIRGKNVVIFGMGRLVGLPSAVWCFQQLATVTTINYFTKNPAYFTKQADILISAVGKPGLIRGEMVKQGVVVIDVGTTIKGKKLRGDVDFQTVSKKASYITPVPGGLGPMTVACLLENLVKLNLHIQQNEPR